MYHIVLLYFILCSRSDQEIEIAYAEISRRLNLRNKKITSAVDAMQEKSQIQDRELMNLKTQNLVHAIEFLTQPTSPQFFRFAL